MSKDNKKGQQYAKVPKMRHPDAKPTDIAVWYALSLFTKWETQHGRPTRSRPETCFPTIARIAEEAHTSPRQAQVSIRRLEKMGYIETSERRGVSKAGVQNAGKQRSNNYILHAVPITPTTPTTDDEMPTDVKTRFTSEGLETTLSFPDRTEIIRGKKPKEIIYK